MSAQGPSGVENTPGLIRGETPLLFALVGLLAVNQGSHEGSGLITFPKALGTRYSALGRWPGTLHHQAPGALYDSLSQA